jgi:hypothetical protein
MFALFSLVRGVGSTASADAAHAHAAPCKTIRPGRNLLRQCIARLEYESSPILAGMQNEKDTGGLLKKNYPVDSAEKFSKE